MSYPYPGSGDQLAPVGEVHHLLQSPPHCLQLLHQLLHLRFQTLHQEQEEEALNHRVYTSSGIVLTQFTQFLFDLKAGKSTTF